MLRRSTRGAVTEYLPVIEQLPFLERAAYSSRLVRSPQSFGVVILSVLMDYTRGLYRYGDTDFVVPFGQFNLDATDPRHWPFHEKRWASVGIDRPFLEWFADNFRFEGPLTPAAFQDNIRWLAELMPASTKLVLLNGSEVPMEHKVEVDRYRHHEVMNAALDEVVAELPRVTICDVRPLVTSTDDLKDTIRHYQRQVYLRIAASLASTVASVEVEQRPLVNRLYRARRKAARQLDRVVSRFQRN